MKQTKRPSLPWKAALLLLLATTAGCATQTPKSPDVGRVVVAPKVEVPDQPAIVRRVDPKPTGYFQRSLLDYFNGSPEKPTK